jgi:anthranilate phosphoribosyltransferase
MSGRASGPEIKNLLVALRDKGETVAEITGAARAMRGSAVRIAAGADAVDTCGTGGSGINTFNISTAAALVAAGCGVKIAKHGNRSASSSVGSADVLEALGVNLTAAPASVERCIKEVGIGFMFAPIFHGAMRHAAAPRREIGTRTIFNILGPLSNPARAKRQVMGVYDASLTVTMAKVLRNLGSRRAMVVHGMDGLDEITITGRTRVTELSEGTIRTYYITPEEFRVKRAGLEEIKGSHAAGENASALLAILRGEPGPKRDVVLMNAAAALTVALKAKDFKEGMDLAALSIDSGRALEKLDKLIEFTKR